MSRGMTFSESCKQMNGQDSDHTPDVYNSERLPPQGSHAESSLLLT